MSYYYQQNLPKPSFFERTCLSKTLRPVDINPTNVPYVVPAFELAQIRDVYNQYQRIDLTQFNALCVRLYPDLNRREASDAIANIFYQVDSTRQGLDFDGFLVAYALVRSARNRY